MIPQPVKEFLSSSDRTTIAYNVIEKGEYERNRFGFSLKIQRGLVPGAFSWSLRRGPHSTVNKAETVTDAIDAVNQAYREMLAR